MIEAFEKNVTQSLTGEELYSRFKNGDSEAFEELVLLYRDDLYRFIHRTVRDHYEAEQLTIETFAQLALNKTPYDSSKASLKTYLFSISKKLMASHMKKREKNKHLSLEDIVETELISKESLSATLEKKEYNGHIHKVMRELKKEYHAVLLLLYFEDMSYKEAGMVMKKNERQIKNLAYRAKVALKKELENDRFIFDAVESAR